MQDSTLWSTLRGICSRIYEASSVATKEIFCIIKCVGGCAVYGVVAIGVETLQRKLIRRKLVEALRLEGRTVCTIAPLIAGVVPP